MKMFTAGIYPRLRSGQAEQPILFNRGRQTEQRSRDGFNLYRLSRSLGNALVYIVAVWLAVLRNQSVEFDIVLRYGLRSKSKLRICLPAPAPQSLSVIFFIFFGSRLLSSCTMGRGTCRGGRALGMECPSSTYKLEL